MPNKSIQERDELHKTIWKIADRLRGKTGAAEFKYYVLTMMFYRYISENLIDFANKNADDPDFNYASKTDEEIKAILKDEGVEEIIKEKGFFLYPSQLFCNVRANASQNENLNVDLHNIFTTIESTTKGYESEKAFKGLFEGFNIRSSDLGQTVQEKNRIITSLLEKVGDMNLGSYEDNSIDVFGDAYEYIISMYAAVGGKTGGEFYTPQEVSELLVKLATSKKKRIRDIYDPACGSGSLLLKAIKVLGKDNVEKGFYGQESEPTTYTLCRMNMFLHNVNFSNFDIALGDTLIDPKHYNPEDDTCQQFEAVVSNPPYSVEWRENKSADILLKKSRFAPAGVLAPKSNGDFAFIMHSLASLDNDGIAAIVCFPGIMYRAGAEKQIRKYLVDNNFVDCVIAMPANLFFGTSIATCILVLKKNRNGNNKVLFINASDFCVKVKKNNKLTDENISEIIKIYEERNEIAHISRLVTIDAIAEQEYSLSPSSYIEAKDTREKIDIKVLNAELDEMERKQAILRAEIKKIIAEIEA